MHVILIGKYVKLGGSVLDSLHCRYRRFHGQKLVVYSLTADKPSGNISIVFRSSSVYSLKYIKVADSITHASVDAVGNSTADRIDSITALFTKPEFEFIMKSFRDRIQKTRLKTWIL